MDKQPTPVIAPGPPAGSGGPWQIFTPKVLVPAVLAIGIAIVLAVQAFNWVLSVPKETAQEKAARKQAQQYDQTAPANPSDVAGFAKNTQNSATSIGKDAANANNLGNLLNGGYSNGSLGTGQNPMAVPGNPMNTDPRIYKTWADADAAARQGGYGAPGFQPAPNNQNTPPSPNPSAASTVDEKREAARKREQQRLTASSIAIDFTSEGNNKSEPTTEVSAKPAVLPPPVVPVSAEAAATDGTEPKPLKQHSCFELCEGDVIETVLTNRIDSSQNGFADVMVTQPVFSHDWDPQGRRLLIPVGSRVLGNVTAVNSSQAQRLFVAFHKLRRPDGSTFSLDNFTGLDMAGSAGLRDLVNHHYLQTFGIAGAIAAIGAVAQVGNSTSGFGYDPSVSIRNGVSQGLGQESIQALNHFLQQPPQMVVREGRNLVKVYLSQDVTLSVYSSRKELAYAPAH